MEECEMLEQGRAHTTYPSGEKTILCEIPLRQCPYGNEGKRTFYTESNTGDVCICNSDGLVEKAGLIEFPVEIKTDSDKPNPRKIRF